MEPGSLADIKTAEAEFRLRITNFALEAEKKYQSLQLKLVNVCANLEFQLKMEKKI
jgi:hypothetical protein